MYLSGLVYTQKHIRQVHVDLLQIGMFAICSVYFIFHVLRFLGGFLKTVQTWANAGVVRKN